MVASIEEQIHQCLIETEEKRCALIDSDNDSNGLGNGKRTTRRKIQKPWRRRAPQSLCQEIDLLSLVSEYDYDLHDSRFQEYCASRGVLHVAGKHGSGYWEYFSDFTKSDTEFFSDESRRFAQEVGGKRHRYSDDDLKSLWRIVIIGRAKLQDCWEIYGSSRGAIERVR